MNITSLLVKHKVNRAVDNVKMQPGHSLQIVFLYFIDLMAKPLHEAVIIFPILLEILSGRIDRFRLTVIQFCALDTWLPYFLLLANNE